MICRILENKKEDLAIVKKCIEDDGVSQYNEENAKIFLSIESSFFVTIFEDEKSDKPMAFAYGYILPKPKNETPCVWVYDFKVLKGYENQGVGIFLMAQLRTIFFYDSPCSSLFFLCDEENKGLLSTIKASQGAGLRNLVPCLIPNDNVDENNNWKGVPKSGMANIKFDKK